MSRYSAVTLVVGVCAPGLFAQAPQQGTSQTPPPLNPLLTTGTPVGTPVLRAIGNQFPVVGQTQGQAPGTNQQMPWRQDPIPPGGQVVDLRNSVAPVPIASLPPALRPQEQPGLFEKFYTQWATSLGLMKPATVSPQNNGYIPGMTRRAKERREKRWIWD